MYDLPQISIPISIFLFLYAGYLFFYIAYSLFNIYHLLRYGIYGFSLYVLITIFAGGTILLIASSIFLLWDVNWAHQIGLSEGAQYYNEDLFPGL